MLKNMTIKVKLIVGFLLAGLIPMIIVAILSLNSATEGLHKEQFNKLTAIKAIKKSQIESFFNDRIGDVNVYSHNKALQEALIKFEEAFMADGEQVGGKKWSKYEKDRWTCPECSTFISWFDRACVNCGKERSEKLFPLG